MGTIIEHRKWAEIVRFHQLNNKYKTYQEKYEEYCPPTVEYKAKVKLHGTNAGIQTFPNGSVYPQGRKQLLTLEHDNYGFYQWVKGKDLSCMRPAFPTLIHGEFIGPGIQHNVAVSQIQKKSFAIFAIEIMIDYLFADDLPQSSLIVDPDYIKSLYPTLPEDFYILPWYKDLKLTIDYANREHLKEVVQYINEQILKVEKCDPWVKDTFNIEGTGEGLVFYPNHKGPKRRSEITRFMFKAKGEKHERPGKKQPVTLDPEYAANITKLVEITVTEARLDQMYDETCQRIADIKKTGQFIKAVNQDVIKECQLEIEKSGLAWKDIAKQVNKKASEWYRAKCQEI